MQSELEKLAAGTAGPYTAVTRKGRIDILIDRHGAWFYQGTPIARPEMVALFSSQLSIQQGDYYLQAPEQLLRIKVEDLPFVIVEVRSKGEGDAQALDLVSNVGEVIEAGPDKPIILTPAHDSDTPLPAVLIRDGLYARFGRNAYYDLVRLASEAKQEDALQSDARQVSVRSRGASFVIGDC